MMYYLLYLSHGFLWSGVRVPSAAREDVMLPKGPVLSTESIPQYVAVYQFTITEVCCKKLVRYMPWEALHDWSVWAT